MKLHSVLKAAAFIAVALASAPTGRATSTTPQERSGSAVTSVKSELALGGQVGKGPWDAGGQVGKGPWDAGGQVG